MPRSSIRCARSSAWGLPFCCGGTTPGLTVNNLLLVADKVLVPGADLALMRQVMALLSLCVILYGLTWEEE